MNKLIFTIIIFLNLNGMDDNPFALLDDTEETSLPVSTNKEVIVKAKTEKISVYSFQLMNMPNTYNFF